MNNPGNQIVHTGDRSFHSKWFAPEETIWRMSAEWDMIVSTMAFVLPKCHRINNHETTEDIPLMVYPEGNGFVAAIQGTAICMSGDDVIEAIECLEESLLSLRQHYGATSDELLGKALQLEKQYVLRVLRPIESSTN